MTLLARRRPRRQSRADLMSTRVHCELHRRRHCAPAGGAEISRSSKAVERPDWAARGGSASATPSLSPLVDTMASLRFLSPTTRQLSLRAATPARFVSTSASLRNATAVNSPKQWARQEVQEIYDGPLMDLIFRAVRTIAIRQSDPAVGVGFRRVLMEMGSPQTRPLSTDSIIRRIKSSYAHF